MLYISGERLENLKQILTKKYTLEAKGQLLFKELDNVSHCSHRNTNYPNLTMIYISKRLNNFENRSIL